MRPRTHLRCTTSSSASRATCQRRPEQLAHGRSGALERIRGTKANAGDASLVALDASSRIQGDNLETWARQLHRVQQHYGCVLLGGCCGTDERHLFSLALRLAEDQDVNHPRR